VTLGVAGFTLLMMLSQIACQNEGAPAPPVPGPVAPVDEGMLSDPPTVRVLLGDRLTGDKLPVVKSAGRVVFSTPEGKELGSVAVLGSSSIRVDGGKLRVGDREFSDENVMIKTPGTGVFTVGVKTYRGNLEIRRRADGTVTLVNHLDLESYIRGVVAGEMPKEWPAQALNVQAVCSRTYAYALVAENKGEGLFDVTADFETTQVYEGVSHETPMTDRAVQETRGMVLMYKGKPFRTYFSSTCGGHTEACGLVWDDYTTIEPLAGVECGYCGQSKWCTPWETRLESGEIERGLAAKGRKVTQIKDVKLSDTNGDGHMDRVELVTQSGTVAMKGNDFRLAVGPGKLKSLRCEVRRSGGVFTFSGRGFGHGVGMCQYGVLGMVRQGKHWEQVVRHYYPASDIRKIYR